MRTVGVAAAAGALVGVAMTATGAAGPARAGSPASPAGLAHAGHRSSAPPTTAFCEQNYHLACYQAGQLQAAYGLPALYRAGVQGQGTAIAIVDSFGSPTIRQDLATFDHEAKLPAPSLTIIQPAGRVPAYKQANAQMVGWAAETTLDVEYAHAVAPRARILLVETPVAESEGETGFPQIARAENYVIDHHLAGVISQSFGATEQTFPGAKALRSLRSAYVNAELHHVTVVSASGDAGAADVGLDQSTYYLHPVTSWPASDPLVTAVGGTQLHLNSAGARTAPDTVWNDTYNRDVNEYLDGDAGPNPLASGGGKSIYFGRPAYQDGVSSAVGDHRGVPDISMSASCAGAVDVYSSFPGQAAGWYPTCGTSEATPLFAGVVTLAAQMTGHPLGSINPMIYQLEAERARGIVDVTSGNNTVSFTQDHAVRTVTGFAARPGYDLASGVGTIDAQYFVPELAALGKYW
ncbi:MAG TPA: S53 family peptidase [Streptosporangiaceae bacterium]|nr:S53 family peptidase [Streptosporangiaceae bacterium]